MNRDDIIRMAREAGCVEDKHYKGEVIFISNDALARFFHMAQAAERERIITKNKPVIESINEHLKTLEQAVQAEREACAKVCDELADASNLVYAGTAAMKCAKAIRAKDNQ